ncbi:unnamed protein product [Parajaminaea phylloscopi]
MAGLLFPTYDIGLTGRPLLVAVTACSALGFALVGYDNGVMGGIIETDAFQAAFHHPDAALVGNIVSIYEIGCFLGSLVSFVIGTPLGRCRTIVVGGVILEVGAALQGAAHSTSCLIVGRVVAGLGMGLVNSTVPMLLAECTPPTDRGLFSRGKLVALALTILNCGIVLSYWIGFAFNFSGLTGNITWRFPILLQSLFIVAIVAVAMVIPDTPRWYVARGQSHHAATVLARLQGKPVDDDGVQSLLQHIQHTHAHEVSAAKNRGFWILMFNPGGNGRDDGVQTRRRWLLACFIQAAQQLGGINALIYYSSTLFVVSIGLDKRQAAALAGGLNTVLIVGAALSIALIDRLGRRPLLLASASAMSAVFVVQAGLVSRIQAGKASRGISNAAVAMLFLFELFFSIGFQATVWLIPSEILPLKIRTRGSALSTASNWICNFLVVKVTPTALEQIGWKVYVVFAVLNLLWVPVIALFLPETKGLTLEQVDELFATDDWKLSGPAWAART